MKVMRLNVQTSVLKLKWHYKESLRWTQVRPSVCSIWYTMLNDLFMNYVILSIKTLIRHSILALISDQFNLKSICIISVNKEHNEDESLLSDSAEPSSPLFHFELGLAWYCFVDDVTYCVTAFMLGCSQVCCIPGETSTCSTMALLAADTVQRLKFKAKWHMHDKLCSPWIQETSKCCFDERLKGKFEHVSGSVR